MSQKNIKDWIFEQDMDYKDKSRLIGIKEVIDLYSFEQIILKKVLENAEKLKQDGRIDRWKNRQTKRRNKGRQTKSSRQAGRGRICSSLDAILVSMISLVVRGWMHWTTGRWPKYEIPWTGASKECWSECSGGLGRSR